ncbi:MAG: DUF5615 family PIN-like protein [Chloroflexi bacterium]|nr:DUF5615 family PIN-like protein [Chloroflexota bacterium]
MRFHLDEDLPQGVAAIARNLGVDVTSAQELGQQGMPDREQLAHAAHEGRAIVSRNRRDFWQLTFTFQEQRLPHAGVCSCHLHWRTTTGPE